MINELITIHRIQIGHRITIHSLDLFYTFSDWTGLANRNQNSLQYVWGYIIYIHSAYRCHTGYWV